MCANARVLMGDPRPQRPSSRFLLLAAVRQTQSFLNRLGNTGRPWDADEWTLNVRAGVSDYNVSDTRFGKALMVYTYDPSNQSHQERQVDFFEASNLDLGWDLPNDGASAVSWPDGSPHTALRMAFFRKAGALTVRVKPAPQQSAQYKVLFSIGNWVQDAGLGDSPVLAEHHHLVETKIALSGLPHAAWYDEEKDNRERRKELAAALAFDDAQFEADFKNYQDSTSHAQVSYRLGAFDD
jgi:hypothetical protein